MPGQGRQQRGLRHHHRHARVFEHEGDPFRGVNRVHRQIRAARFEDGEDRDDELGRAIGQQADEDVGADAGTGEPVRELVRLGVEIAVGEVRAFEGKRGRVRRGCRLGFEPLVQGAVFGEMRRLGAGFRGEAALFGFGEQRDAPERERRLRGDGCKKGRELLQPAVDGGGVEQIGVVVALEQQPARAFAEVEEKVEVESALGVPVAGEGEVPERRRAGVAIEVEDDLDQRRATRGAGNAQGPQNAAERGLVVIIRVKDFAPDLTQVVFESGFGPEHGPDGEQVDAVAGEAGLARHRLTGRAKAEDDFGLSGEPVQQGFHGCHEEYDQGGALRRGEALQRLVQRGVKQEFAGCGAAGAHERPGAVRGQIERLRERGELAGPPLQGFADLGAVGRGLPDVVFERRGRFESG